GRRPSLKASFAWHDDTASSTRLRPTSLEPRRRPRPAIARSSSWTTVCLTIHIISDSTIGGSPRALPSISRCSERSAAHCSPSVLPSTRRSISSQQLPRTSALVPHGSWHRPVLALPPRHHLKRFPEQ